MKRIFLFIFSALFFSGFILPVSAAAPLPVTDLVATTISSTSIRLSWTVPNSVTLNQDAHFFYTKIATKAAGPFLPFSTQTESSIEKTGNRRMTMLIGNLNQATTYWFTMRHTEDFINWSDVSNVATVTTRPSYYVNVLKTPQGWEMRINDTPYFVRGMAYTAENVGEDPSVGTLQDWMLEDENHNGRIDGAYDTYFDLNKNHVRDSTEPVVGDFQLMKDMGVNTIRLYHHSSNDPSVQAGYGSFSGTKLQYNHAPNKVLLRDLFATYGIRVAIGDFLGAYTVGSGVTTNPGTDYRDTTQKNRMTASVKQMVKDFKDEPFLLMYVLGNENNIGGNTNTNASQFPTDFAKFVEQMAQIIHQEDPYHPVAVCLGDVNLDTFLPIMARNAPSVDIFAANVFRQGTFGNFFTQAKSLYNNKPVLISEFGDRTPVVTAGALNETRQRDIFINTWNGIVANSSGKAGADNAIGGVIYQFTDNWWQNGQPHVHNIGDRNQEFQGVTAQFSEGTSPFLRESRLVHYAFQNLWTGVPVPAQFLPEELEVSLDPTPIPNSTPFPKSSLVKVEAGASQIVHLSERILLKGRIELDPPSQTLPYSLKIKWTQSSGPGQTKFGDDASLVTLAQFNFSGSYALRLSAELDGVSFQDDIYIDVQPEKSETNSGSHDGSLPLSINEISAGSSALLYYQASSDGTVQFVVRNAANKKVEQFSTTVSQAGIYSQSWLPPQLSAGFYSITITQNGQLLKREIVMILK